MLSLRFSLMQLFYNLTCFCKFIHHYLINDIANKPNILGRKSSLKSHGERFGSLRTGDKLIKYDESFGAIEETQERESKQY